MSKLKNLGPTWADIDDNNRRIRIRKSKTDKAAGNVGATIVLPAKVLGRTHLPDGGKGILTGLAWRVATRGYQKSAFPWSAARSQHSIYSSESHGGGSNIMLRHADKSMQAVYIGRNHLLKGIQDKLDRYVLNGLTMDEAYEKGMVMDFGEMTIPIQLRA
jgi:hypothetical protein